MLTRRQIRIKVMQHVYAHYNGNQISLRESVKQYQASCYDMKMLYLTLLGLLKSVWDYADEQATIQKKKRRSEAPLNPHFDEIVALEPLRLIAQHPYLKQQLTDLKISIWELEFNFLNKSLHLNPMKLIRMRRPRVSSSNRNFSLPSSKMWLRPMSSYTYISKI